jgi:hypothetical protein
MKKPDFDYYRMVVSTQHDPDILQSELKDLINESVAYIEKDDGSKVPCSDGVMPLGEWAENVCPKLAYKIRESAYEHFAVNEKQMASFIRCCMTFIRQEFEKGA